MTLGAIGGGEAGAHIGAIIDTFVARVSELLSVPQSGGLGGSAVGGITESRLPKIRTTQRGSPENV